MRLHLTRAQGSFYQTHACGRTGGGERRERRDLPPLPGVGDEVTGKVGRIMGWGLFMDLEGGLRAMLHVDEVAVKPGEEGRDPNVRAMFKEGDELKVRAPNLAVRAMFKEGDELQVCQYWLCAPCSRRATSSRCAPKLERRTGALPAVLCSSGNRRRPARLCSARACSLHAGRAHSPFCVCTLLSSSSAGEHGAHTADVQRPQHELRQEWTPTREWVSHRCH